ncbi:carbon-nitrogen hydrolase family protein [Bythopirellula goksoeyrii]|uniref:(R)-stereoselective amidase n=1 Tax=Bythopirellula goksoeyrii TaxID=1400387 RepID=A0A5B9Q8I2_9BACT|nr:carbon-nitrogen hydrolase family protein [Bythopirellula goksoeyrii]QEG33216.1 (R)-stereoselective amidase [Bythopirellula goksoeyrii]
MQSQQYQINLLAMQLVLFGCLWSPGKLWGEARTEVSSVGESGQLNVATCQFPVSSDISENAKWIRKQMRQASEQEADIAHFSETALSGYAGVDRPDMKDYDWNLHSVEFESILALAKELELWIVLGSAHRLSEGHKPHNSLYVINDQGNIIDRYDKRFCTNGDLRHYSPGDHFVTFDIHGVRCGLLICYDIRFPELYRQYCSQGVQLMFHSFHNARQKPGKIHPKIMPPTAQARAATNGMFISINNSCVKHSWASLFITPDGLIEQRLETDRPGVMVNCVDVQKVYYDASREYRMQSIQGVWNSGETVIDPRSTDRLGY